MPITLVKYTGTHFKSALAAQYTAWVLARFAKRGWRTVLVLSHPPEDLTWLQPLDKAGAEVHYLPRARGNFDWACARRARRLCEQVDADVFHVDNIHTSPLVGAALAGVPVRIWHKRAMQPAFEEGRTPTLRDRLAPSVRLSVALATRTIAVSNAVRDELVELGVGRSKVVVRNNPGPHPGFSPAPDRRAVRASLGYAEDDVVIATVGHAVPVKGWDVLVKSFTEVSAEAPKARLLMVGSLSAPHERETAEALRAWIDRHGLAKRVSFTGHRSDLSVILAAADLFVIPSRSEGFGRTIGEAMAAGLACIATRVGIAPELIRDGMNGLLVERGNVAEMARSLGLLVRDAGLRNRLGEAAKAPSPLPTPDEHEESILALYLSLLEQSGRLNRPQ